MKYNCFHFRFLIPAVLFFSNLVCAQEDQVLTFTEVMFRPSVSNSEFIEIFNMSDTTVVDLRNYKIKYHTSKNENISASIDSALLQPGQYAVLFENDYDIQSGVYSDLPENALVLKIEDNAFGSTGMSNSSDRTIYLLDTEGDTVDVYKYSANNSAGISDEKMDFRLQNFETNWSNTTILNGTPGKINSVTKKEYDLSISDVTISNELIIEDDSLLISISIHNIGTKTAENFFISVYDDINLNSTGQEPERIFREEYASLSPADSITTQVLIDSMQLRSYSIISKIEFSLDQDTINNVYSNIFNVLPKPREFGDVVINEIMYKPAQDEPEWIELFNNSNDIINLKNWDVKDRSKKTNITNENNFIDPGGYIIIADDESIVQFYNIHSSIIIADLPSLNNSGDKLSLADSMGFVIDSLEYFSDWGGGSDGRSLEKISSMLSGSDSLNWLSSISTLRATPGRVNSVSLKTYDACIDSIIISPAQPVKDDNVEINVILKNLGVEEIHDINISVYNDVNMDSTASENELINSGIVSSISPQETINFISTLFNVHVNNYNLIADVEFNRDEYPENNSLQYKFTVREKPVDYNSLLINEIMYKPENDEPEWIEIYNNSADTINLNEWYFADFKDTVKISDTTLLINPATFMILSDDESINEYYEIISPVLGISLPSLNNSWDKIKIIDPFYRIIDSVNYKSSWGGYSDSRSLERKLFSTHGNDSTNWASSISLSRATPGTANSVVPEEFDLIISEISLQSEHAIIGEEIEIEVKIRNFGIHRIDSYYIELFNDINSDSLTDPSELATTIFGAAVNPNDSSTQRIQFTNFEAGYNQLIAVITTNPEDYSENNTAYLSFIGIQLNEVRYDIIINEIMYSPVSPEPEWIELYNNSSKIVELKGYRISDDSDTNKVIHGSILLTPQSYAVVASDSSIIDIHPSIDNLFIQKLPVLNNSEDRLMILDSLDRIIDSLRYKSGWGGKSGASLERISAHGSSTDSSNWSASLTPGTPGRLNSISRKDYDLIISDFRAIPENPILLDEIILQATIKNIGLYAAENFKVKFIIDDQIQFIIDEILQDSLDTDDSVTIQASNSFLLDKTTPVRAYIEFGSDLNLLNNSDTIIIEPGYSQHSIIINEFMFNPRSGESEWIEFFNTSGSDVNIKNWTVSDISPRISQKLLIDYDYIIQPQEYFTIARDTVNFPISKSTNVFEIPFGSLGNSEDGIIILDRNGNVIDSIFYTRNWYTIRGQSQERIDTGTSGNDSTNWLPSMDVTGGSPGRVNSTNNIVEYSDNQVVINEIMFAPAAGNSEFVELLNLSDEVIDLGGWAFQEAGGESIRISNKLLLQPGAYFVFTADSSIVANYNYLKDDEFLSILNMSDLQLSNTSDRIIISDAFRNVIDSLTYFDSWHNKNILSDQDRSLERINPFIPGDNQNNWSSSVADEGATPGIENSIFTKKSAHTSNITIEPNPFSPDNDGFEDFTIISYNLKSVTSQIRVKIYDDHGRLVRILSNNMASGSSGDILFDGLDDSGRPLRIGMYIVYLEAIESNSGTVEAMKKVLVVARML